MLDDKAGDKDIAKQQKKSGEFYTEEPTGLSFDRLYKAMNRELPWPIAYVVALVLRGRGLIGWPLQPMDAFGPVGSEMRISFEQIPPTAMSAWAPVIEQLRDLKFEPIEFAIADMIGQKRKVESLWIDEVGTTLVTLEWMRMPGATGVEENVAVEFNSYGLDDPEITTMWLSPKHMFDFDLFDLPFVEIEQESSRKPLSDAYQRHLSRITRRDFQYLTDENDVAEHLQRSERRFQALLDQGLLRRISQQEIDRLAQIEFE